MTIPNEAASPIVTPGWTYGDGSSEPSEVKESGLTKREYFAAQILAGLWSNLAEIQKMEEKGVTPDEWTAKRSVELADALIAALNKK